MYKLKSGKLLVESDSTSARADNQHEQETQLEIGMREAYKNLDVGANIEITADLLVETHEKIFRDVDPEMSGKLRISEAQLEQELEAAGERFAKAYPREILKNDQEESREEFKAQIALALAVYHGELQKIQPFEMGNDEALRVLLEHQMDMLLGEVSRPEIEMDRYEAAVEQAKTGNPEQLAELILENHELSPDLIQESIEREREMEERSR